MASGSNDAHDAIKGSGPKDADTLVKKAGANDADTAVAAAAKERDNYIQSRVLVASHHVQFGYHMHRHEVSTCIITRSIRSLEEAGGGGDDDGGGGED